MDSSAEEEVGALMELLLLLELIQIDKQHRYPSNWKRLAWECKDRAGWRCERCGVRHGERRYSMWSGKCRPVWLHAHHVNADPANPVPELQALCPSCHWQRKHAEARVKLEKLKHQKLLERR